MMLYALTVELIFTMSPPRLLYSQFSAKLEKWQLHEVHTVSSGRA